MKTGDKIGLFFLLALAGTAAVIILLNIEYTIRVVTISSIPFVVGYLINYFIEKINNKNS
jgi:hypothetical protein